MSCSSIKIIFFLSILSSFILLTSATNTKQLCVKTESNDYNTNSDEYTCTSNPLKVLFPNIYEEDEDDHESDTINPLNPIDKDDELTKDVLEERLKILVLVVDIGVTQRIGGSISEQKAILQVLYSMEQYFWNEVLSKRFYTGVVGQCKNNNELCAFWTSVKECESNRGFMLNNCAASCRLCMLLHTNFD